MIFHDGDALNVGLIQKVPISEWLMEGETSTPPIGEQPSAGGQMPFYISYVHIGNYFPLCCCSVDKTLNFHSR